MTDSEINELNRLEELKLVHDSGKALYTFAQYTYSKFKQTHFHETYYNILNLFAHEKIKNLIINVPTQHGKSLGSSQNLPAFIAGIRPDAKIALISYASTKARSFGRKIMGLMREDKYKQIFPDVSYPERGYTGVESNTGELRESINSEGSMKFIGIEGPLIGDPVDILLMDDLYKGWKEANSPTIQKSAIDWYVSVADSRLHNDSQQLCVFTRWSENDLVAFLESLGLVVNLDFDGDIEEQIRNLDDDQWLKVNFPALKVGIPTKLDPREEGEPLFPWRHSKKKLEASRAKDWNKFQCMQQGDPQDKKGRLYKDFKTYPNLPEAIGERKNCTDVADGGGDFVCSINYVRSVNYQDNLKYVINVYFSKDGSEDTEPEVAKLLIKDDIRYSRMESNSGGRAFARNVQKIAKRCDIDPRHRTENKQSRIITNAPNVNNEVVFPSNWHIIWPEFYDHVIRFKRDFKQNENDDGADALTDIILVEEEDNWEGVETEIN